jgi:hypothetical protein
VDIPFHVGNEVEAVMNQKAKLVGNRKARRTDTISEEQDSADLIVRCAALA